MIIEVEREDGKRILLNAEYIVVAEPLPGKDQCAVTMITGQKFVVKATLDEIHRVAHTMHATLQEIAGALTSSSMQATSKSGPKQG